MELSLMEEKANSSGCKCKAMIKGDKDKKQLVDKPDNF